MARSLKPFTDFNGAMRRTENDLLLRIIRMHQTQRGELARALAMLGIKNPGLSQQAADIGRNTARQAGEEILATLPAVERHVRAYLDASLDDVVLPFVSPAPVVDNDATRARVKALAAGWGLTLAGTLATAVLRLQADAIDDSQASALLLGEASDMLGVSDKVSVFTKAMSQLRLQVVDDLWTETNDSILEVFGGIADLVGEQTPFRKQWVSAVDERTTETCLVMNGVTVGLDEPFDLSGLSPIFSNEVDAPPGHWNCRAALALVRAEDANDDLTRRMETAAQEEIERRKGLSSGDRRRELELAQSKGRARHSILTGVGGTGSGDRVFYTRKIYRQPGSSVERGGVTGIGREERRVVSKKGKRK